MTGHDSFPELVVGRVLDALEPADDALLTAHLQTCEACRDLLADLQQTAASLAYDVEQVEPPPALLERIRAALPEPAMVELDSLAAPRGHRWARRPTQPVGVRRLTPRAAVRVAAGVAAAAVLFSGGYAWHSHEQGRSAALASDQMVLEHLQSGSAYSVGLVSGGAATGTAVVDGRHVDLVTSGLGRNDPQNSIYVLWAAAAGTTKMTAIAGFDVTTDGLSVVHATLPPGMVAPTTFGVTHEAGRTLPKTPGQPVLGVRNG
ncbi:MAG TPA: anti-sigma factor [Mycobacteriales bacterium]